MVCNSPCPSSDANFAAPIKLHDSRRRFRKPQDSPPCSAWMTSTCLRCSLRKVQDKVVAVNTIAARMAKSQRIADSSEDSTSSAEMRFLCCATKLLFSRAVDRMSESVIKKKVCEARASRFQV